MIARYIIATLFHVLRDDRVRTRVEDELRTVFGHAHSGPIGSRWNDCKYLIACVKETLRVCPPGRDVHWRQSSTDEVIDGLRVPAGTHFGVCLYALHHNPAAFPEPDVFRPERFLERSKPDGFLPFLRGPGACPAQELAYPSICMPIAHLMLHHDMTYSENAFPLAENGFSTTQWSSRFVPGSENLVLRFLTRRL